MEKMNVNLSEYLKKVAAEAGIEPLMTFRAVWDIESNRGELCMYENLELVSVIVPEVELADRDEFEAWARMKSNEIRKATSQPTKVNEVTTKTK